MGKINKYANLYNQNGELIHSIDPRSGKLNDFSIKETEELLDSLDKGSIEYNNAMSWLMQMYQNPKTKEDKEYVQELQNNLIKKLQDEQNKKKQREAAGKTSLEELDEAVDEYNKNSDIEEAEIVSESIPDSTTGGDKQGTESK